MTSIFKNKNSFWPEYKNLEQQVLELTKYVCFCDAQVDVFSRENSNLIIQIVSEIESISKELYRRYADENKSEDQHVINQSKPKQSVNADGNQNQAAEDDCNQNIEKKQYPSFDFCCLQRLDQKWHLTLKEISVTGVNFYFSDKFQSFAPLANVYSDDDTLKCQWKEAYDKLKHNNRACIKRATIGNLISALGALFVLNLYYRDHNCNDYKFYLKGDLFDSRVGSEIFSVNCCSALYLYYSTEMSDDSIKGLSQDSLNKSLYIKRFDRETMRFFHRNECLDWIETLKNIANAPEMKPYRENLNSDEYKGLTLVDICTKLGGYDLVNKIICFKNDVKNFDTTGIRGNRELILNTHSKIYETLTFEEFERSIKSHE
ncbi:hypothetical protein [uncultured Anaerobiospirillum sp.]|uniref:hypothetical protein n=1 Tax=uncultured Anaerobiospirillum sp. TaxID=265728 RepID=UPI00280426DF|nr:hypothetical protein [uncultured Anaerobiospirillum sp.]